MANFYIGIDCPSEKEAEKLKNKIESIDLYQDGLDICETRVSLVSKQGLLPELEEYAHINSLELLVEIWPDYLDYEEAEESDCLETYAYK